jgi:hypothetical protein
MDEREARQNRRNSDTENPRSRQPRHQSEHFGSHVPGAACYLTEHIMIEYN